MPYLFAAWKVGLRRHASLGPGLSSLWLLLLFLLAGGNLGAQKGEAPEADRSKSYYHFALGHLYHQFAQQFMNDEYVERAIAEYKAALANDPGSVVIRIEMMNLYAGANQLASVVDVAEEILEEDSSNVEVRRLLGNVYRTFATRDRRGVNVQLLQKAIEQFERIVEIEPDSAENHSQLGLLYRSAGDADRARRSLRRAVELDPAQSDAQVNLAYMLLEARDFDEAISVLEEIAEKDRTNQRYVTALADAYQQVGRFRDAANLFEKILAEGGNTLELRRRFADNLYYSRQVDKALEQYRTLVQASPENIEFHIRISRIHAYRGEMEEAWAALNRARRVDPESLDVQFDALGLLEAEGRVREAADQAADLLDRTAKQEYTPGERRRRTGLQMRLGALQQKLDSPESAVATFRRIASNDPDAKPQALAQVVQTWRQAGNFNRAEKEARKAAEESDGDPFLADVLAGVLSDRGKTREAIKVVERRSDESGPDMATLLAMARIYTQGRDFERAAGRIAKAQELAESDQDRIDVLFAYGSTYERAKQFEKSEANFRELLKIDPENSTALNYLGYMFADRGVHLEEAHDLIQRALDLEPNNGAYLDSLGWVYFRQGKLELAAKYLERSLKQFGRDPVVHTHLGDVYFKQGRVAEAKEHWTRGLEEWNRSAPADRESEQMDSLRRKLAELELSMADEAKKERDAAKR